MWAKQERDHGTPEVLNLQCSEYAFAFVFAMYRYFEVLEPLRSGMSDKDLKSL